MNQATPIELSQPVKPRKMAELTGYSIGALDKKRAGEWTFTAITSMRTVSATWRGTRS